MRKDEYIEDQIEAAEEMLSGLDCQPSNPATCALLSIAHSLLALAVEGSR